MVVLRRAVEILVLVLVLTACNPEPSGGREKVNYRAGPTTDEAHGSGILGTLGTGTTKCPQRPLRDYAEKMVGADVTTADYWPGIVALGAESPDGSRAEYFCGGILVESRTVLTAAHCLAKASQDANSGYWQSERRPTSGWSLIVFANNGRLREDSATTTTKIVGGGVFQNDTERYYSDYKNRQFNDIAFLKLEEDLPPPYAELSASLKADPAIEGHLVWAAGFGAINPVAPPSDAFDSRRGPESTKAQSERLQEAILQFKPRNKCAAGNDEAISDTMHLCAGWDEGGHDSCQGDSGGPLAAIDQQGCPVVIGLASYGQGCGEPGRYGIYTRISQYKEWISKVAPNASFVDAQLPAVGQEAFKRIIETALGASTNTGLELRVERLGAPADLPMRDGLTYQLVIRSDLDGRLLIVDRTEKGFYNIVHPVMRGDDNSIEAGDEVEIPLVAGISDPSATTETGELLVLVLPADIDIGNIFVAPNKIATKGFTPPDQLSGVQLSDEIKRLSDMVGVGGAGENQYLAKGFSYTFVR